MASESIWSLAGWALKLAGDGRLSFSFDRSIVAALSGPYRAADEFLLPPHAVGDAFHTVTWVDFDGKEHPLQQIDITQQPHSDVDGSERPRLYSLMDGRVRVYPHPTALGAVRFLYQRRHPELCADTPSNAPVIDTVADDGSGYTRFSLTASSPFSPGDYVDIVSDQYPYRVIFGDLYVGSSLASDVSLYAPYSYVSSVSVQGMRVIASGRSPFVALPLEFRACIYEKTASAVLRRTGDMTQSEASLEIAQDELSRILGILSPRASGNRKKVLNKNSLIRGRMRRTCWRR